MPNNLPQRKLGPFSVSAIGFGCTNLSHAYGIPPPLAVAEALLLRALDCGVTLFDTAALYGSVPMKNWSGAYSAATVSGLYWPASAELPPSTASG